MLKKDIQPGVVYAMYDWKGSVPKPVMFLDVPSRLYRFDDGAGFGRAPADAKISAGTYRNHYQTTGYAVVMASQYHDNIEEIAATVMPALGRDAVLAGTVTRHALAETGIHRDILTSTAKIPGETYADAIARYKAEQKAAQEYQEIKAARDLEVQAAGERLVAALGRHGITARHWRYDRSISLDAGAMNELSDLLGGLAAPGTGEPRTVHVNRA